MIALLVMPQSKTIVARFCARERGRTIWIADAHRDDGKRYVLRFKMRPETKRALLSVKYRPSNNGVRFAKRFSLGRQRDSHFTLARTEN